MPRKFIYSEPYANKLPGSDKNYNFRTITTYNVDTNNKAIPGSQAIFLYYAPILNQFRMPANQSGSSGGFLKGDENGKGINFGNYVIAGRSIGGKPYEFLKYSNEDKNDGNIPSIHKVGDTVLGATAQVSLLTKGGIFYNGAINSVKVAAQKQPGLSKVLTAQPNVAQAPVPAQPAGGAPQRNNPDEITDEEVKNAKGEPLTNNNIPAGIEAGQFGNFKYPLDLASSKQDRIKFKLFEYQGATIEGNTAEIFNLNGTGKIINKNISNLLGSVTLPIQPSISDSNTVEWSGATLNGFEAAAFGKSFDLMPTENIAAAAAKIASDIATAAKGISANGGNNSVAQALKVFLAQEAIGVRGLLSRASGAVLNPNLELLFSGPQLRPFNFTFRLSPRDAPEATEVRKIIRFFKQGMAVRTAKNNLFLKAPHVFGIEYQVSDTDGPHKSLNRIKKCALLSCDVDYTPDGTYMTFNDPARTLTSYQLSLRFSELEPILDEDYTSIGSDEIRSDEIGF